MTRVVVVGHIEIVGYLIQARLANELADRLDHGHYAIARFFIYLYPIILTIINL